MLYQHEGKTSLQIAAEITASVFQSRAAHPSDVAAMLGELTKAIDVIHNPELAEPVAPKKEKPTPAVPIKKSIENEYIVCLHDGKRFKSLKRHLSTVYGQTPEQYRNAFGLPHDYPMTAPAYAAQRSALAKATGLGNFRKTAAAA